MDHLFSAVCASTFSYLLWSMARFIFGGKAVAAWKWRRRGFFRGCWYAAYYFALAATAAALSWHDYLTAAIFGAGYLAMSYEEPQVKSGALYRKEYVREASNG